MSQQLAERATSEPSSKAPAPRKRRRSLPPGYSRRAVWWLLLPAIICEGAVYVVPILAGIFTSFTRVNQFSIRNWLSAPFVGFDNFRSVVAEPVIAGPILRSFLVSCLYVACVVAISLFIGFVATVFIRSLRRARFFQVLFIVPYAVPVYAGVLAWDFAFQGHGAINSLLGSDTLWLQGPHAFVAMVITAVWRTWPFVFLMMLAATSSISPELFEALQVDGGGRWAETRHIIFPHVRSQLGILALLLTVWNFNDFVTPFVFFGQVAPPAANLFPLSVYVTTFISFAYSIGAAITLMAVILLSVLIVLPYMKMTRLGEEAS
jgi:multiple sugar transport system permease protein